LRKNGRACCDELVVGDGGTNASVSLDEGLVTVPGELVHTSWRDGYPVFVVLDLAGDADLH
jgi:hypothetical protein